MMANKAKATGEPVSATMASVLALMVDNGGELVRFQGGYWASRGAHPLIRRTGEWSGTSTINALEARGLIEFTEWQDGRRGRFPIAAKLKNVPPLKKAVAP